MYTILPLVLLLKSEIVFLNFSLQRQSVGPGEGGGGSGDTLIVKELVTSDRNHESGRIPPAKIFQADNIQIEETVGRP